MTFVGDAAIGVSTEVSKFMEEKLKVTNNKITTIMNGVDVDNLLPLNAVEKLNIKKEWNIEDGKYVFVMHSRIDEVKNHLLMVEAVHSLSDEVKKRIVVVCSGTQSGDYYCQVLDRIKEYGLDDIFKFVGWVEARKILGIAGFLVLPSFNEGFALSVIEAYLMKVPVMRTKTAGFEEQKYCYPIDMYNPSDIVNIVNDIYRNGLEKYKVNVEDAYQLAINEMTSQKMTEKTVEVYMKVCSKSDKVIEATLRK
jgi:glycosyltransferase involved in cell wall biosynthesis